jgi:hypothetical protein
MPRFDIVSDPEKYFPSGVMGDPTQASKVKGQEINEYVIEQLMTLGGWVPIQLPMMLFAIFTSLLQAFIFTTLATIYIAQKVVHDEGHGEEGHGESHAPAAHHG